MNTLRKLAVASLLSCSSMMVSAITDNQVFAYAEANFPSVFSGSASAGQYQQYNYRYYPTSGNFLAVDTAGVIFVLGPFTNNVITSAGPASSYALAISAWEATLTNPNPGGGACDGVTMTYSGNVTGSYSNGTKVCFASSTTSLSFSGKTLTNPTSDTLQPPYAVYMFKDAAAGYSYEVVLKSGVLYEINVLSTSGTTFHGQFAP